MKNELKNLVPNEITRKIETALSATLKRNLFSVVFGETGRGKTLTCEHFAAAHPEAALIALPGAVNHAEFVQEVAFGLLGRDFGGTRRNKAEIRSYLLKNRRMIIIDEFNQVLLSQTKSAIVKSFEFVRRNIFDLTDTPVMLVFTRYSLQDMRHGALHEFLEQFRGRLGITLQIPARMLKVSEVTPIVRDYVPDADNALIDAAYAIAAAGDGRIRTLVKYLELAGEYTAEHGGKISSKLLIHLSTRYEDGGSWPED